MYDFTFFYIFGCLSLFSSICVCLTIFRHGSKTSSAKLVLFLHISQILEDITSFPYLFSSENCLYVNALRNLAVLSNILCVGFILALTQHILFNTFDRNDHYPCLQKIVNIMKVFFFGRDVSVENKYQLSWWSEYFIWIIPILSSTINVIFNSSSTVLKNGWCQEKTDTFYFVDFSIPLLIILICVSISFAYTLRQVYKSKSQDMRIVFWKGMGLYTLITLICFTPKCILMFLTDPVSVSENEDLIRAEWFFLLLYIAGFLYSIVFIGEASTIIAFESFFNKNDEINYDAKDNSDSFHNRNSLNHSTSSKKSSPSLNLTTLSSAKNELTENFVKNDLIIDNI